MEIGVYSFAEISPGEAAGRRIGELLEEIELADRVGLDVFGVGEHHRPDFAVSAPATVLAAAAARTERIRLSSAVSVISSDEPIRVFQQFSTLDLISGGRAEIMAGRGSFVESFPLFGHDLRDYDRLFAEKLETLLELREAGSERGVFPRPLQQPLPLWIAVGGTPQSAVRAGMLGLPMALAIIGGEPERFRGFVELFREAARQGGHEPPAVGINSHGFVAESREQAIEDSFGPVSEVMNRIGRERGWPPMTRDDYEASAELHGANFVGAPQDLVEKILLQHEWFGHDRFLIQLTVGPMPHEKVLRAIELLGTEVAPAVRAALG
ncbi:MAG TPA: LLM class flavin-dependent oxidoreductase [Gaiellaceae bacterium]|nr:LLM class flavin-dependent oxidoreductase [Gaiellaceae bacterium]